MRRNSKLATRATGLDLTRKPGLMAFGLLTALLARPAMAQAPPSVPPQGEPQAAPAIPIPLPEPAQIDPKPRSQGRYQGPYDESTSRELFRACDDNSDDRLDVFESADCFDVLPSPRDLKGFARIDNDRDGYVTWPEFDQRFRKGLENGGTFIVRTVRPFVMPEPPPQPLSPLQKFIRLYDKDGDGGLSPAEIADLLKATGLPEIVAKVLMQSDFDQSGKIEEVELAPWHSQLPKPPDTARSAQKAGLTQPWLDADGNLDESIDAAELTMLLRRLDPGLLRWTKNLLAKLDTNKDGKLSVTELEQAKQPAAAGKPANQTKPAVTPGTKPVQAPSR